MSELSFEIHYDVELVESDILDLLQTTLADVAPRFCETLRVLKYEGDRDAVHIDTSVPHRLRDTALDKGTLRGATYEKLASESPARYPRRFGSVFMRGKTPKTFISIRFDQYVPAMPIGDSWLWSNSISGHVGTNRVDGLDRADWVRLFVCRLSAHPALLWAMARDDDEFQERNFRDNTVHGGVLGRDIRRWLPGLYWLNVFGRPYVDLIGAETLVSAPAVVGQVGDAVHVELYEDPSLWASDPSRAQHRSVLNHLGPRFFFDKGEPDRESSAPDFGLAPLPERPPFEVFTSDGKHFTPLPRLDDEAR